jgi:hypothetical protein
MSDNQYDNGHDNGFDRLVKLERQRMSENTSVPPPSVPPKTPTCSYCGQPLDAPHASCPFCPERRENQDSPDNGGNEPLKATMRGYFEDEAL